MKRTFEAPVSYEELYRNHQLRVNRLCRVWLANPQEAEEVAQEVFLKMFHAYQAQDDFRAMRWGPWLTTVTLNACRDRLRSQEWQWWQHARAEYQEEDYLSSWVTPEDDALSHEMLALISHAFAQLSQRQQEVFCLRYLEGRSTQQVATLLGVTPGSVKQHLSRAMKHLRHIHFAENANILPIQRYLSEELFPSPPH